MAAYGYSATLATGDFDQQHAKHQCPDCDGEGRTPNGSCTGDTAGGWADTCDTCHGTGKATPARCTACDGAHPTQTCPQVRALLMKEGE